MLKDDNELNPREASISKTAKDFVKIAFPQVWNELLARLNTLRPLTGNEILQGTTTFIALFSAYGIREAGRIAQADDAGVEAGDLIKGILNAQIQMFEAKVTYEEPKLPKDRHSPKGLKSPQSTGREITD